MIARIVVILSVLLLFCFSAVGFAANPDHSEALGSTPN